jgi:hypothetical protein
MIDPFQPNRVGRSEVSHGGRSAQIWRSRIARLTCDLDLSEPRNCQLSQPSHSWEGWRFSKSLILAALGRFGGVGRVFARSISHARVRVRVRARVVLIHKNPPNPPNPPIFFSLPLVYRHFRRSVAFVATLPTLPTLPFLNSDGSALVNRVFNHRSARGIRTQALRPCWPAQLECARPYSRQLAADPRGNSPRAFVRSGLLGNFPTSRPSCGDPIPKTADTFREFPGRSFTEFFGSAPRWGSSPSWRAANLFRFSPSPSLARRRFA